MVFKEYKKNRASFLKNKQKKNILKIKKSGDQHFIIFKNHFCLGQKFNYIIKVISSLKKFNNSLYLTVKNLLEI